MKNRLKSDDHFHILLQSPEQKFILNVKKYPLSDLLLMCKTDGSIVKPSVLCLIMYFLTRDNTSSTVFFYPLK